MTSPEEQPQQPKQDEQQFFLVPAVALMATVEILQQLPWKQVNQIIPVLTSSQQVTGKPKEEK